MPSLELHQCERAKLVDKYTNASYLEYLSLSLSFSLSLSLSLYIRFLLSGKEITRTILRGERASRLRRRVKAGRHESDAETRLTSGINAIARFNVRGAAAARMRDSVDR